MSPRQRSIQVPRSILALEGWNAARFISFVLYLVTLALPAMSWAQTGSSESSTSSVSDNPVPESESVLALRSEVPEPVIEIQPAKRSEWVSKRRENTGQRAAGGAMITGAIACLAVGVPATGVGLALGSISGEPWNVITALGLGVTAISIPLFYFGIRNVRRANGNLQAVPLPGGAAARVSFRF